jgi:hypothetical protein
MANWVKNRNDYRTMTGDELYEEAVRGINVDYKELAIALAERVRFTGLL